jgi:Transcriptional regulator
MAHASSPAGLSSGTGPGTPFRPRAAACGISQPTLSAAVKQLETELAVPIVQRGRRFEGFTPEGFRVVEWAQRILADCDGLQQEVGEMRRG